MVLTVTPPDGYTPSVPEWHTPADTHVPLPGDDDQPWNHVDEQPNHCPPLDVQAGQTEYVTPPDTAYERMIEKAGELHELSDLRHHKRARGDHDYYLNIAEVRLDSLDGARRFVADITRHVRRHDVDCAVDYRDRFTVHLTDGDGTVKGIRPSCNRRNLIDSDSRCAHCATRAAKTDVDDLVDVVKRDRVERHSVDPAKRAAFVKRVKRAGGDVLVTIPQATHYRDVVYIAAVDCGGERILPEHQRSRYTADLLMANGDSRRIAFGERVRLARKRRKDLSDNPDKLTHVPAIDALPRALWHAVAREHGATVYDFSHKPHPRFPALVTEVRFRSDTELRDAVSAALTMLDGAAEQVDVPAQVEPPVSSTEFALAF